jgi:hypothetical protein
MADENAKTSGAGGNTTDGDGITLEKALAIAKCLSGIAKSVEDFKYAHYNALNSVQRETLQNAIDLLRSTADNFVDMGVEPIFRTFLRIELDIFSAPR